MRWVVASGRGAEPIVGTIVADPVAVFTIVDIHP